MSSKQTTANELYFATLKWQTLHPKYFCVMNEINKMQQFQYLRTLTYKLQ